MVRQARPGSGYCANTEDGAAIVCGGPLELVVQTDRYSSPEDGEVEIVERKGLGHPDAICDALAETISAALCRAYFEQFGEILHHNVDKILLCAGSARPSFGGGEILEPIEFHLGGRATTEYCGIRIPASDIAVEACQKWLCENLPDLDLKYVRFVPKLHPGSAALRGLFAKGGIVPMSNDTSCGLGFAPLTRLERVVLAVESELNSSRTKHCHPALGRDVKVMGVRHGRRVQLTIGCAMIDRFISNAADYLQMRSIAEELALAAARNISDHDFNAVVNAADDLERGEIFLTVTGTSAESADDGEVGRGNRACGLITPYRPMSIEAVSGKNPVNHVGKLYNVAAARIGERLANDLRGVSGADCLLVSRIGFPIHDAQIVDVRLRIDRKAAAHHVAAVAETVRDELRQIGGRSLPPGHKHSTD